jgi:pyrroloquinoline quinone biosynthesis protein D
MTEALTPVIPVTPALPQCPRLSRLFRLQFESAQDAWVLLYPEGMVQLNQSAAEILRRCDGRRKIDDIVAELQALFQIYGIRPQVVALLQEGQSRGWID